MVERAIVSFHVLCFYIFRSQFEISPDITNKIARRRSNSILSWKVSVWLVAVIDSYTTHQHQIHHSTIWKIEKMRGCHTKLATMIKFLLIKSLQTFQSLCSDSECSRKHWRWCARMDVMAFHMRSNMQIACNEIENS